MEIEFEETVLMIASSLQKETSKQYKYTRSQSFLKSKSNHHSLITMPLKGAKNDIKMFKRKFTHYNMHYIETSRDRGTLFSKQYLNNWLLHHFQTSTKDIYLFYTGRGEENGDWLLETYENPYGDSFSLKQLINLWQESGASKRIHLYVFMESPYSGGWCRQLSQMQNIYNISIFASYCEDQNGYDLLSGGQLNQSIMQINKYQMENALNGLMNTQMRQAPVYINKNMEKPAQLTRQHIILLNKDIRNAKQINSGKSGQQLKNNDKDEKGKNKDKNKQQNEKYEKIGNKIKDDYDQPIKINNEIKKPKLSQNQLNKAKQIIMKKGKATDWDSLKTKTQFILKACQLRCLPECFGQLNKINYLNIGQNPLEEFPESILELHSLTKLLVYKTGIKSLPENFGTQLKNLEFLKIQQNKLTKLPDSICQLSKLSEFWVFGNKLTSLPKDFAKLKALQLLEITIDDSSQAQLSSLPIDAWTNLRYMRIQLLEMKKKDFEKKCEHVELFQWVTQWID